MFDSYSVWKVYHCWQLCMNTHAMGGTKIILQRAKCVPRASSVPHLFAVIEAFSTSELKPASGKVVNMCRGVNCMLGLSLQRDGCQIVGGWLAAAGVGCEIRLGIDTWQEAVLVWSWCGWEWSSEICSVGLGASAEEEYIYICVCITSSASPAPCEKNNKCNIFFLSS